MNRRDALKSAVAGIAGAVAGVFGKNAAPCEAIPFDGVADRVAVPECACCPTSWTVYLNGKKIGTSTEAVVGKWKIP